MNLHIVNLIIKREYLTRVKKKSFIITTFLVPILFAVLCSLPSVIMVMANEEAKKVAVVDQSGIVAGALEDSDVLTFTEFPGADPVAVKSSLDSLGMDILLSISPLDTAKKDLTATAYSVKPLGMDASASIERQINDAVENYRIGSYNIEGLDEIMKAVKPDVKLVSYQMDESGKETLSESGIYMFLSMILGMIIYMFISMFGGMVMSSVIEEKSSRVVEVLVSSVKATELLFGKVIGVAMVALTQFFMWIALTVLILAVVGGITGVSLENMGGADQVAQMTQMTQMPGMADGSVSDITSMMESVSAPADSLSAQPSEMSVIFSTLGNINYGKLIVVFILFFIFGYLLYASIFAALGSAVENEADSNQLVLPFTIPLMIGFFISLYVFKAPDGGLAFWASMIPFTSPMVMLTRVLFGVPDWEIVASLVILVLSFIACAWVSAKIYKVGILMFGKKTTFKDLWKWLKMK